MNKKITLLILNQTGSQVKQATIHRSFVFAVLTLISFLIVFTGFLVKKCFDLNKELLEAEKFSGVVSEQSDKIVFQQAQIRKFTSEIAALKSKVIKLDEFEEKVRIIANLDTGKKGESIFGVGGFMPDDMKPYSVIDENRNDVIRSMHSEIKSITGAAESKGKDMENLLSALEKKVNILASTPSISPAKGWVTSEFGYREHPLTGRRSFHEGLDIAARKGTPVYAPADGVITFSSKKGYLGNLIEISHGYGMKTRYGHLNKMLKKRGERVKRGEKIALIGNSGRSTGPHVHYEVHVNGMPVNPSKYILD